jgi:hypothetical protein
MSDTELYWERVSKAFGDERKWTDLNGQQQQVVIQSINALLAVLHRIV